MKKIFWIGLSLFLFGIWIISFAFWQKTQSNDFTNDGISSFSQKFFFSLFIPSPLPSPSAVSTVLVSPKKLIPFDVYYDISCPHCQQFSESVLVPFLSKNAHFFKIRLIPFAKTADPKNQNESLLLFCLLSSHSPLDILEKTSKISPDWKKWRDAQPNAEVLKTCMNNSESYSQVQTIREQAREQGVRGTPTLVLDGKIFEGSLSATAFATLVSSYLQ